MSNSNKSIANKVFEKTNEARKSYYDNQEQWDQIFKKRRQPGNEIFLLLVDIYHLLPKGYRYYPDGYGEFFSDLGFNVELPSRAVWYGMGIKMIKLFQ